MAFTTFLRQRTRRGEGLVLGTCQRLLQLVNSNHILLALITEGNIDYREHNDEHKQPYLRTDHLRCQQVTTQYGTQVQLTGRFRVFFDCRLLDQLNRLFERTLFLLLLF